MILFISFIKSLKISDNNFSLNIEFIAKFSNNIEKHVKIIEYIKLITYRCNTVQYNNIVDTCKISTI